MTSAFLSTRRAKHRGQCSVGFIALLHYSQAWLSIQETPEAEGEELQKQKADPDKVFAKRREEHAEALAAR